MRTKLLTAAFALLTIPAVALPAGAATEADCSAMFNTADSNKDGVLTATESKAVFDAYHTANKVPADGKLKRETYMADCKNGMMHVNAQPEAGAPFEGANSFTEAQAMDRLIGSGLTEVSGLKKDDKGIWRATAKRSGEKVNAALDFKGNVVVSK